MDFKINLYALIPLLTLLQGLIFSILLFYRKFKEERNSDFWLGLALLLLGLNGVPYMLGWMGISVLWEKYTYLPWDGFWLAIPPVLYFFLKSLTNDAWQLSLKRDIWHFVPYFIYFIEHLIVGLIGLNNKDLVQWWWNDIPYIDIFYQILSPLVNIYYFVLSYRLYKNYRLWAVNEFSDAEKVSFTWVRNFWYIYLALTLIDYLNSFYVKMTGLDAEPIKYQMIWLGYFSDAVLMYYLSLSGYMQKRVKSILFNEKQEKITVNTEGGILETPNEENTKNKNTLSDADLMLWKNKVIAYFEQEKPYLQAELTLSEVAQNLKTNTSILSQVINTGFDKNFNDFVNEYRVKAFQEKIKSNQYQHLTMLAVAFECGFNSKATFNRAYKKMTGHNPSALNNN